MSLPTLVLIAALAALAGLVVYSLLLRRFDPDGRLQRGKAAQRGQRREAGRAQASGIGEAALKLLPVARDQQQSMAMQIRRAGWKITTGSYWAASAASAAVGVGLGVALAVSMRNPAPAARIGAFAASALAGALAPRLLMHSAIKRRRADIEAALPNTLELLAVVVGAGQSIEGGIRTVAQRSSGPLAEEFAQVSTDVTYCGRTVQEALQDMAERCKVREVSLFAAAMRQSMRAGSPIAEVLKTQSEKISERYYLKVEEQSNKIRTKMIFPTVFFILPPIFIISLGPTILKLLAELPKIM